MFRIFSNECGKLIKMFLNMFVFLYVFLMGHTFAILRYNLRQFAKIPIHMFLFSQKDFLLSKKKYDQTNLFL